MSASRRGPGSGRVASLGRAFDEARFGPARTLDLHLLRPSAAQAAQRVETWLQERQLQGATEALVVTGSGNNSDERGVSPVREAVVTRLARLKRTGIVTAVQEHSAGSFIVMLAPISRRFDAPARNRDPKPPAPVVPAQLQALDAGTLEALGALARLSLDQLGLKNPSDGQIEHEMRSQFARLSQGLPAPPWTGPVLREAISRAHDELLLG
jgi:hypothetical protein